MPHKDKAKHVAYMKAWRAANKERTAATEKAWRAANKDRVTANVKAWSEANKERRAAVAKAWRAANKERRAAARDAWRAANPERDAAHKRKYRTGWSDEQYREKLSEQGHRCGICGVDQCSTGRAFAADHCHKTGKQRGVLCSKCNTAIGLLGDKSSGVLKAAAYLLAYEVETKWEPITNDEHTIYEGATDNSAHLQPTHQRGRHDLRDVGGNDKQSDAAPEVAVGRHARQAA
jgi:hypothetical protein